MRYYESISNFTMKYFYLEINDIEKTYSFIGYDESINFMKIDRLGFYDIVNGLIAQNYKQL